MSINARVSVPPDAVTVDFSVVNVDLLSPPLVETESPLSTRAARPSWSLLEFPVPDWIPSVVFPEGPDYRFSHFGSPLT